METHKSEMTLSRKMKLSVGVASPLSRGGEGVNMTVELFFTGQPNAKTELVVNLMDVKSFMQKELDPIHGRHLETDMGLSSDPNILLEQLWDQLKAKWTYPGVRISGIKLSWGPSLMLQKMEI